MFIINEENAEETFEKIRKPFPLADLKFMVANESIDEKGIGKILLYADARAYRKILDREIGVANWDSQIIIQGDVIVCNLKIKIAGEWVCKSDGAGFTKTNSVKGGISEALKRACINWGIGEYLYSLTDIKGKVEKKDFNNNEIIEKEEIKYQIPEEYLLEDDVIEMKKEKGWVLFKLKEKYKQNPKEIKKKINLFLEKEGLDMQLQELNMLEEKLLRKLSKELGAI